MIISFAWTTPALLAGRKTVTRRNWLNRHADKFEAGILVDAWDKSPRFKGKKVAVIRLTQEPVLEWIADMPDEDFEAEGFKFFQENPELIPTAFNLKPTETMWDRFKFWREAGQTLWVIRFEIVKFV